MANKSYFIFKSSQIGRIESNCEIQYEIQFETQLPIWDGWPCSVCELPNSISNLVSNCILFFLNWDYLNMLSNLFSIVLSNYHLILINLRVFLKTRLIFQNETLLPSSVSPKSSPLDTLVGISKTHTSLLVVAFPIFGILFETSTPH